MTVGNPDLEPSEQVKLRDELIARLCHDVRTPIGAVLTWLELLKAQANDAQALRAVAAAQQSARDLVEIVSGVEDAQRLAAGAVELQIAPVDLVVLLGFAADRAASSAAGRGVVLARELGSSRVLVRGDDTRLGRAFGRMLFHCASLSGPGTIRLALRAEAQQARVDIVCASLPLGAPLQQAVIAESAWPSLTGRDGQALLDFAVSSRVLRLHGGRLEAVALHDGAGSQFSATLPLA